MTTLYASMIRLHALHDGLLLQDAGQWANAAFYGILHQVEPSLAEALHQWNGRKPFTISSLSGLPRSRQAYAQVRAGAECWLRVTMLGEEVFQPFIQRFLYGGVRPQIQLGPVAFGVSEVLTTPGSHAWAGFVDAAQLAGPSLPGESLSKSGDLDSKGQPKSGDLDSRERLRLEFASPTGFNLGTGTLGRPHYELFPHPALVFGSLASKWRDYLAPELEVAYIEDIASEARVSDYRLHTQTLNWKGRVQKGFSGECTYDLRSMASDDCAWLWRLARFAFYAGVGGKTTQGMGQCRMR